MIFVQDYSWKVAYHDKSHDIISQNIVLFISVQRGPISRHYSSCSIKRQSVWMNQAESSESSAPEAREGAYLVDSN